jgi:hypothetical protein
MARKTPVLLRRAPLSGDINAITRYTRKPMRSGGPDMICAAIDGKHDVTADFDAIVLEHLLDPDAQGIIEQLDGAARGMKLTKADRAEIAAFRERLITIIHRHNTTGHGS